MDSPLEGKMDELKACPFCGKPFEIIESPMYGYMIRHNTGCAFYSDGETGSIYANKQELIDDLNTRPLEDSLQAEIARLREAQRWIPVGERLPEDMTEVLALHGLCVTTAKYYHYCGLLSKHGWYQIDGMKLGVSWATHWMPLPEPPQEAEGN